MGVLTILMVFDAVSVSLTGGDVKVKAKSETAFYFLRSLAQFVRKDMKLTSDWERRGVREDISPVEVIGSGTQLVHAMEKIRTEEHGDITSIRKVFVSQVIVKAKIKGKREPVYLVQYDAPARQFQLVGGRRRKSETDPLTVMKREIAEELSGNNLTYLEDYQLAELVSNIELTSLSPTYGAFSSYNFTIYQAVFKCPQLKLGPNDRWVTLAELTSGETKDGKCISSEVICKVDALLPGGLDGLKLSLDGVQDRR
jgi:8-oxo-dGTP pyrophosphatase MutT (NUDIX family)